MNEAALIAHRLISVPSVTPARGEIFDVVEELLRPLGFEIHRLVAGEGDEGSDEAPVENLLAIRSGEGGGHFAFAGHLDVVPPGEGWRSDPFVPEIRGELMYGRGAVDMKGAIAAMIAALAHLPRDAGTVSLILTGDEEGPAIHGTRALIAFMEQAGLCPDFCLVGEPTSVHRLGDMMKIGRRGSVNIWLDVEGTQGHVAYPHNADNPIPRLIAMLAELDRIELDQGTEWFQPSNLEITHLDAVNPAYNVIPARAQARISIRFNDCHTGQSLERMVSEVAQRHGGRAMAIISGEPFLTPPGPFSRIVSEAVEAETGIVPEASTSGGTSDARFLRALCPVIEFGLCNATMHKCDEAVAIGDLERLSRIYLRIARDTLASLTGGERGHQPGE